MSAEQDRYQDYQDECVREWEARCKSCGACCGIFDGDPCEHLVEQGDGRHLCTVYENRFGLRKTRSGREFHCVSIRDILHETWPGSHVCGYRSEG